MTILTQANMDAMQGKLADALADVNALAWHAGEGADEACGTDPLLAGQLREAQGLAQEAMGALNRFKACFYTMNFPGPVAPNFGSK